MKSCQSLRMSVQAQGDVVPSPFLTNSFYVKAVAMACSPWPGQRASSAVRHFPLVRYRFISIKPFHLDKLICKGEFYAIRTISLHRVTRPAAL